MCFRHKAASLHDISPTLIILGPKFSRQALS